MKCIPGDYLMKLVERMSRVCKAVIKATGKEDPELVTSAAEDKFITLTSL